MNIMESEPNLVFPSDLETKLRSIMVEDMDVRLKDLTNLVALQETEIALLSLVLLVTIVTLIVKDIKHDRPSSR